MVYYTPCRRDTLKLCKSYQVTPLVVWPGEEPSRACIHVSDALSCSIGSNGLEKLRAAFASMLICYLEKGAGEGLPWFGAR